MASALRPAVPVLPSAWYKAWRLMVLPLLPKPLASSAESSCAGARMLQSLAVHAVSSGCQARRCL